MERDSSLNTQTKGGEFAMELPLVSDFLTTVRLATGGVCAVSGLDVDYTEDIKVCVTEGLLILKRNGYARARVSFFFAEMLCMASFVVITGLTMNLMPSRNVIITEKLPIVAEGTRLEI